MKKFITTVMCCALGFTALAQTNFRSLSLEEALTTAKQESKMVFIDFYTDWCGPCKMMARDVFPQKKVGDFFNAKFVCIKLNAEKEGQEAAKRFEVKAYPTFLVLDTQGEVQLDIKGAMDADAFIAKVETGLNPEWAPARMEARYKGGERTPELVDRYALYLMEQGKEAEGFGVVNGYFASLTDAQRLEAANAFLYTRYTLEWGDAKAKFMVAHRNDFPEPMKETVAERINRLYHTQVVRYFSGYMFREGKFVEADYEILKKEVQCVDARYVSEYPPMFRLIESRVKNDDAAFWADCKKDYDQLTLSDRELLIMNLPRLIQTEDIVVLKDVSQFVRAHLHEMSANTIMMTGRVLSGIESKFKK